jgi:signal transduction histidine kinase
VGRTDLEIFPGELAASFRDNDRRVLDAGQALEFEEVAPHDDGPHTYLSVKFPLRDASGRFWAVCGISTDITARKRAQDALRGAHDELERRVAERTSALARANEELTREMAVRRREEQQRRRLEAQIQQTRSLESVGVLAGGIAHDFNNYLAAILGNAGLALMDLEPASPIREMLSEIQDNAERASQLTEQLLAYAGKGKIAPQQIDMNQLLMEMHHLHEAVVSSATEISYELEDDLPAISVDPGQIRQVIMNLMANASEALGHEGGTVTVRTGTLHVDGVFLSSAFLAEELAEGTYVFIQVSDTGEGMDEAQRFKLFDPFFSTRRPEGGLGLAAALGIVRSHRGSIHSAPRRGTTITVLLPMSRDPGEDQSATSQRDRGRSVEGPILVIEEERSVRRVIATILQRQGFQVVQARNGSEGLALLEKNTAGIRAVVLDLTMSGIHGSDVLLQLRRHHADLPVVLVSGYGEAHARSAAGGNIAAFVHKPFNPNDLVDTLHNVLAK